MFNDLFPDEEDASLAQQQTDVVLGAGAQASHPSTSFVALLNS